MRVLLLMVLLAGCTDPGEQVQVRIDNQSTQAHDFEVVVWWDGDEDVQRGRATGNVEASQGMQLFSFPAHCGDAGVLVYVGALGNGTSTVWEQEWDQASCQEQEVVFVMEPSGIRFVASS